MERTYGQLGINHFEDLRMFYTARENGIHPPNILPHKMDNFVG